MKKRLLSMLLVLALVLSLVPVIGLTASAGEGDVAEVNGTGYSSWSDAMDAAKAAAVAGDVTIKLLQDIGDYADAGNSTGHKIYIDFNGHKITKSPGNPSKLTLIIKSEADIDSAIYSSLPTQIWDVRGNITLSEHKMIQKSKLYLEINGNGYTIDCAATTDAPQDYMFKFRSVSGTKTEYRVFIDDLTMVTSQCFKRVLCIEKADGAPVELTLNNVTLDNSSCYSPEGEYKGACVINNYSEMKVEGACSFITGENSWAAIDLTGKSENIAKLSFDNAASVTFTDGRTAAKKAEEPLVGLTGNSTVTNPDAVNLVSVSAASYRNKDGYELTGAYLQKSNGNTTYYPAFESATDLAATGDTIIFAGVSYLTKNVTLPDNVRIDLNGHGLIRSGYTFALGANNVFVIGCEKDLENAETYIRSQSSDFEGFYELSADFTVSKTATINVPYKKLTIEGNAHTISGNSEAFINKTTNYILELYNTSSNNPVDIIFKNINVATGENNEKCVLVDGASGKRINMTLENVTLDNADAHTSVERPYRGACLVNNASDVTVKGECGFITGENSWAAIDLTGKTGNIAKLAFDDETYVTFTDGRDLDKMIEEPLVGSEDMTLATVTNADTAGLFAVEKNAHGENKPKKDGYDLAACSIGDVKYGSLQAALEFATDADTIKLLSDISEDCAITADVTIELNGHALKGNHETLSDTTPIRLLIKSQDDMKNAMKIAPDSVRQTWEIGNDITLTQNVRIQNRYLTINGNNKTIYGAEGAGPEEQTLQMIAIDSVDRDSRNNVKIYDLNFVCSERFKNVLAVQNKDADVNGIHLTLKNITIDHSKCSGDGAAILNFGSDITVDGKFEVKTGKNSCYAIGIDVEKKYARLTFVTGSDIKFKDNRTSAQKKDRELIFVSHREDNYVTVEGQFRDEELKEIMDGDYIRGYNLNVPDCIYNSTIKAATEKQALVLGGSEAGEYIISGDSKNGFTLKNADGKYVSYTDGTLKTDSDTAYIWKYDGGLYAETKVNTRSGFWFWSYSTTKVTKNYLTFDGTKLVVSTSKVCAEVQVTDDNHTWVYLHDGDGCHEAYCTKCGYHDDPEEHEYDTTTHLCVCGKLDPKQCYVSNVEVAEKKTASYGGFWLFTRKVTKYQYTIKPVAQNVCVSKVQYSANIENWNTGTVFTSDVKLNEFYIRVTDSNGKVTNWKWNGQSVEPEDK